MDQSTSSDQFASGFAEVYEVILAVSIDNGQHGVVGVGSGLVSSDFFVLSIRSAVFHKVGKEFVFFIFGRDVGKFVAIFDDVHGATGHRNDFHIHFVSVVAGPVKTDSVHCVGAFKNEAFAAPVEGAGDQRIVIRLGLAVNRNGDGSSGDLDSGIGHNSGNDDFANDFFGIEGKGACVGVLSFTSQVNGFKCFAINFHLEVGEKAVGNGAGGHDETKVNRVVNVDDITVCNISFFDVGVDGGLTFRVAACKESNADEAHKC